MRLRQEKSSLVGKKYIKGVCWEAVGTPEGALAMWLKCWLMELLCHLLALSSGASLGFAFHSRDWKMGIHYSSLPERV